LHRMWRPSTKQTI